MKPVEKLTISDLSVNPVWEYVTAGETVVTPVDDLPVDSLQARVVGTRIQLANGSRLWAIVSGISLKNPRSTRHFLTLSVENHGAWFHLARYHDVDYDQRGPKQLAKFLGLPVSSVFPIEYDLSGLVSADIVLVKGTIPLVPQERLSEDELIQIALEKDEA
jgi:hypothetical protein